MGRAEFPLGALRAEQVHAERRVIIIDIPAEERPPAVHRTLGKLAALITLQSHDLEGFTRCRLPCGKMNRFVICCAREPPLRLTDRPPFLGADHVR